jgi:hypothetical protein
MSRAIEAVAAFIHAHSIISALGATWLGVYVPLPPLMGRPHQLVPQPPWATAGLLAFWKRIPGRWQARRHQLPASVARAVWRETPIPSAAQHAGPADARSSRASFHDGERGYLSQASEGRWAMPILNGDRLITAEAEHPRLRRPLNPAFNVSAVRDLVPVFWYHADMLVTMFYSFIDDPSLVKSRCLQAGRRGRRRV